MPHVTRQQGRHLAENSTLPLCSFVQCAHTGTKASRAMRWSSAAALQTSNVRLMQSRGRGVHTVTDASRSARRRRSGMGAC